MKNSAVPPYPAPSPPKDFPGAAERFEPVDGSAPRTPPSRPLPSRSLTLVLSGSPALRRRVTCDLKARDVPLRALTRPADLWSAGMPPAPACLICEHDPKRGIDAVQILQGIEERAWLLPTVVFVASDHAMPELVRIMKTGAESLIAKDGNMAELPDAVDAALKDAAIQSQWHQAAVDAINRMATLNSRERDIVKLMLHGMLNKEIAERLGLALVTIKVHRARAMKKLEVENPTQIGKIACLAGVFKHNPAFWRRI